MKKDEEAESDTDDIDHRVERTGSPHREALPVSQGCSQEQDSSFFGVQIEMKSVKVELAGLLLLIDKENFHLGDNFGPWLGWIRGLSSLALCS
ncbi:hypothetical protein U0070_002482 [Myodes glareolus]|uniref:Uncharacterized protein n=1 Tax=Myodes glareolus TaxID=447135 RepID=A0AAW0GW12_MYOGA